MESTFLGMKTTFSGIKSTFLGLNLKKSAFLVIRYSVGLLSVVSRSSLGKTRQGISTVKETAILINVLFGGWEFLGRSLVCPWFFLAL